MRIFKCDNSLSSETIHMNQVKTPQIPINYGKVANIQLQISP